MKISELNKNWVLILTSAFILLFMLGGKEIWTEEIRWANICQEMMIRHDYFHPYLFHTPYYDKPLLSYWIIIAISHLIGTLNAWALRLPSVFAGLITIWGTYRLGNKLISQQTGRIAAWMLISTYFFVFWARVASVDMLNVAGIILAIVWYFENKNKPSFSSYAIFFIILSIASLFKGIIAAAIVVVALLPDLIAQNNWKKHLRWSLPFGVIPGLIIYLLPFLTSAHFNNHHYAENGLWKVFQENLVRYFKPFDHKGHIYTYLIFLPIYIFPWILFFIPAICSLPKRWSSMSANSRWLIWSLLLVFIFLTCSGSRRSYYVLPLLPLAILVTADWIRLGIEQAKIRNRLAGYVIVIFCIINFSIFGIIYPLAASYGGEKQFAFDIRQQAEKIHPWPNWHILISNVDPKISFYLQSPNLVKKSDPAYFPSNKNEILITRLNYFPNALKSKYVQIPMKQNLGDRLIGKQEPYVTIALIPLS